MRTCGCDPHAPSPPSTANPPGQPTLDRRVAVHATAMARMRSEFGVHGPSDQLRALAWQSTDDPAIALLDAWAVVADTVAFYSERIATEGFLRTATERRSVRELARTLGYELRPGVAAQVALAFAVETTEGAPETVLVSRGTPVQSIPGQDELPQVFETGEDLEVRRAWNEIPAVASQPQSLRYGTTVIWLRGRSTTVRPGDTVLVVGTERWDYGAWVGPDPRPAGTERDDEKWDFRVVTGVEVEPEGRGNWIRLTLDRPIGYRRTHQLVAVDNITVHTFSQRANLFGWNAPDPNLLVTERGGPPGAIDEQSNWKWGGYGVTSSDHPDGLEIDGDVKTLLPGPDSWIVLEEPGRTEAYRVKAATPGGASKFALSGRLTRVRVDITENLDSFNRRQAVVHCCSQPLPAGEKPMQDAIGGTDLVVVATDPPLPPGRAVLVRGVDTANGLPAAEAVTLLSCVPKGETMILTVDPPLEHSYMPASVRVLGNVVTATHGETVEQVLGSGDGRATFSRFSPRRTPLTHVRSTTADGARADLVVRVDRVAWTEVPSLDTAGPNDRVYSLRHQEDGAALIVLGDGVHGARPSTGAENITATYRVGLGEPGAIAAGKLSLLPRRPLGVRSVTNPISAADWAPPETLAEARVNAPLRVRTLDRAVSLTDHEDFARGYAGVGPARADLVWDGRAELVVVTLLGSGAAPVSGGLVADLRAALEASRDPSSTLLLLTGEILWFGIRVEVLRDPAYEPATVDAGVLAALNAAFAAPAGSLGSAVTAASALVAVKSVPGVVACTMPRLLRLPNPPTSDPALPPVLPPDSAASDLLVALPARWQSPPEGYARRRREGEPLARLRGRVNPAQLLALADRAVVVR